MTPTPRLVPDRPSDALRCVLDIGARRTLLPSEVTHWEALLTDAAAAPAHPSRGVVDDECMEFVRMVGDEFGNDAGVRLRNLFAALQAAALPADRPNGAVLSALIVVRDRFFPADQPERDRDAAWDMVNGAINGAALPAVPELVAYRLLTRADTVQSGDEVLGDDTVSWKPLVGWERGLRYDPALFMPARRMLAAAPAQEAK